MVRKRGGGWLAALLTVVACAQLPERSVREHELQDAKVGQRFRVGCTEGVLIRRWKDGWDARLEHLQQFERDLSDFAVSVPLSCA